MDIKRTINDIPFSFTDNLFKKELGENELRKLVKKKGKKKNRKE